MLNVINIIYLAFVSLSLQYFFYCVWGGFLVIIIHVLAHFLPDVFTTIIRGEQDKFFQKLFHKNVKWKHIAVLTLIKYLFFPLI